MRRKRLAGTYPDTFGERLQRGRYMPGEIGQYINTAHGMSSVGDLALPDRFGWPICQLGAPTFDWADGDGVNPYVAPVGMVLTAGGTPIATSATPWVRGSGAAVTSTAFEGAESYTTATVMDPAAANDIVALCLAYVQVPTASQQMLCGTRTSLGTNPGWLIDVTSGASLRFGVDDGPASAFRSIVNIAGGWHMVLGTFDVSAQTAGILDNFVDGGTATTAALTPPFASAAGFGIASSPNSAWATADLVKIARVMVWYRAGLVTEVTTAAWFRRLCRYVLGIRDLQQDGAATFARTSAATAPIGARWHVYGTGACRSGNTEGLLIESTRINKVYNCGPDNTVVTGWTATGGMGLTVQADIAALLGAGLQEFGPGVLQVANATGGVQTVRSGATTANVNPHSLSVFGRITAGAGPRVGLYDNSAGTFQDCGAMTDGYVRTLIHGAVPGDTDRVFALQIPDGCTVRFTMAQLEESPRCTSPIPNTATAATAQRPLDDFVTTDDPLDGGGSVELTVTPMDWSANESPGAVMFLSGSGNPAIYVQGGTWWARIDGTTQLDSGVAPVDGTPHRIRLRWVTGGQQSIEVWDATPQLLARVASAYDGTLYSAGTWELASTNGSMLVTDFHTYRNGGG